MTSTAHSFRQRWLVVVLQVTVGSFCALSDYVVVEAADNVDGLAANAIFGDEFISQNLMSVEHRAAQLEPVDQYNFLLNWVLPSATHESVRFVGRFTSTNGVHSAFASAAVVSVRNDSATQPVLRPPGSNLHCPVITLVEVAKNLGRLPQLRKRVTQLPDSSSNDQRRAKAATLFLIELALGDHAAAEVAIDQLMELVETADENPWPLITVAWVGIQNPKSRHLVADLLAEISMRQLPPFRDAAPTTLTEQITSINNLLFRYPGKDRTSREAAQQPILANWISADIATAQSHAGGWPGSLGLRQDQNLQIVSSHKQSLLFYRFPLRGNFDFSCELPSRVNGEICLMYGGLFASPQGEPLQNRHGNIRSDQLKPFDPPMTPPREWAWCRLRVRGKECTVFFNGRVLLHRTLGDNHDPWLAIRTTSSRQRPVLRNVRIDHTPDVPSEVKLCADENLTGWWPYFDESVGAGCAWQQTADTNGYGLFAAREPEFRGTCKESLLCYYRPLIDGDSIEYDFYHDPGVTEVHPAIDGVTFLLQPNGVTLHPISHGRFEQGGTDPAGQTVIERDRRLQAALSLKQREWNHCRLQLVQNRIDVFLNEQLVYSHPVRAIDWQSSPQAGFGFFRYAGDREVRVRNVVWRSPQETEVPGRVDHQIVDRSLHSLDERLGDLALFQHDFTTGGLPSEIFMRPAGKTFSIDVLPAGVKHSQTSQGSWSDSSITPVFNLYGDFDVTASFASLQVTEPQHGGCAVVLRTNDGHVVQLSRRKRKGDLHRVYLTWRVPAGDGEFRFNKDLIISEAPSGRLRVARRGDTYYFLIAENDSPVYRQVVEQKVDDGGQQGARVEIRMVASEGASASVLWKEIRIAAEQLKQFRFHVTEDSISDDHWIALAGADSLEKLILDKTNITDDDLLRLKANPGIRLLYLKDTRISSVGVRNFSYLNRLEHLHLTVTQIDDTAAKTLAGFPNLQTLGLSYTNVGDATIRELSQLRKLSVLGLSRTNVTDASIESLSRMAALKSVDLRRTKISDSGLAKLRKALPNCEIKHE